MLRIPSNLGRRFSWLKDKSRCANVGRSRSACVMRLWAALRFLSRLKPLCTDNTESMSANALLEMSSVSKLLRFSRGFKRPPSLPVRVSRKNSGEEKSKQICRFSSHRGPTQSSSTSVVRLLCCTSSDLGASPRCKSFRCLSILQKHANQLRS